MNLVDLLIEYGSIEKIPISRFEKILNNEDEIKIKTMLQNMFLLTNLKTIKCVNRYYYNKSGSKEDEQNMKKLKSHSCFYTKKFLGINSNVPDCIECHKTCISLFKQGKLNKI